MEHELPEVLDGIDEPVSVEELEAVVRRAGQRRRATLVAGAAGLLLCGAVAGAIARGPGDDRSIGMADSGQDPRPPMPAVGVAMDSNVAFPGPLTPMFRREASGVAIRVYRSALPPGQHGPGARNGCKGWHTILGELSNTAAVGFAYAPDLPGDSFLLLSAGQLGQTEGEPATWAAVRTGAGVATARFRLGEATDSMAPQAGIALLAVPGNGGDGFVEGLDAEGKLVATQKLSEIAYPEPDPACSLACEVVGPGMPAHTEPLKPGQDPMATPPPPTLPDPPATTSSGSPAATIAAPTPGPDPSGKGAMAAGTVHPCGPDIPPPHPTPYPAPAPILPAPPPFDGSSGPATATTAVPPPPAGGPSGAPSATTSTLAPSATVPPPTTTSQSPTSTAPAAQAP